MNKKIELLKEAVRCYKVNHINGDKNEKLLLDYIDELEQLTIPVVMHPLPDANKLYKMAETIVSKQVMILNMPENKQIDWEELKNNWFDWLNEEIKGNCA